MTTTEHTVIRLTVVLDVEVADPVALTAAAVESVDVRFDGDEPEREEFRADAERSLCRALWWACDDLAPVRGVPGVASADMVDLVAVPAPDPASAGG